MASFDRNYKEDELREWGDAYLEIWQMKTLCVLPAIENVFVR